MEWKQELTNSILLTQRVIKNETHWPSKYPQYVSVLQHLGRGRREFSTASWALAKCNGLYAKYVVKIEQNAVCCAMEQQQPVIKLLLNTFIQISPPRLQAWLQSPAWPRRRVWRRPGARPRPQADPCSVDWKCASCNSATWLPYLYL